VFEVVVLELLEFLFGGDFGGGAHAVEDEDAVEVVGFVLPDAGTVAGFGFDEGLAGEVLGLEFEGAGADDVGVDVGEGEAAFLAFLFAGGVGEDGVDVDAVVVGVAGVVHDEEADVVTDLGGGEADAAVFAHELEHAVDEGAEVGVEGVDGPAGLAESGVRVGDDGEVVIHETFGLSE
jgi:hypothetical protein